MNFFIAFELITVNCRVLLIVQRICSIVILKQAVKHQLSALNHSITGANFKLILVKINKYIPPTLGANLPTTWSFASRLYSISKSELERSLCA